jgi:hypothetical protein
MKGVGRRTSVTNREELHNLDVVQGITQPVESTVDLIPCDDLYLQGIRLALKFVVYTLHGNQYVQSFS